MRKRRPTRPIVISAIVAVAIILAIMLVVG